jgi:hypothetical protein
LLHLQAKDGVQKQAFQALMLFSSKYPKNLHERGLGLFLLGRPQEVLMLIALI